MFITITPKHLPERAGTGTCFWCPALLNASTIKTQLPFSPKSSFEGPLTVGGEPQPMTSAEQKIHLLASRGDLLRDQLRPRAAGPFFPFPTHPLAVLFQDNRSTRDFYLRGFDGSSSQRVKEWRLPRTPDVLWWAATGDKATDCQTAMVAALVIHCLVLLLLDILVITREPHWWNTIRIPTKSSPSENYHVHS